MRRITIFYDGSAYTYSWIKAMIWARQEFRHYGFEVEFAEFWDYLPIKDYLSEKLFHKKNSNRYNHVTTKKYDIVFLAFHRSLSGICKDIERRELFLKTMRENSKMICWLDTADSTGSCLFDVLPYVDKYLKKQLLKDKKMYGRSFYRDRLYCQFYHDYFNVVEDCACELNSTIKDDRYYSKLGVSWNIALSDNYELRNHSLLRPFDMKFKVYTKEVAKYIDIYYGGSNPNVYGEVVGYQRKIMLEKLTMLSNLKIPDVYKKISRKDYLNELHHSKAILSPFGWGEICIRDFEAFIYKCVMIKPSMDHCVTYPNLYEKNVTYVPLNWDFDDFNQIICQVPYGTYKDIAEEGQNKYEKYVLGENAKVLFVNHLLRQIGFLHE